MTNPFHSALPNPYKRKKQQDGKKEATWEVIKYGNGSPTEFDNLLDDSCLVLALEQAERSLGVRSNQASKTFVDSSVTASLSPAENLRKDTQVQKMAEAPFLSGNSPLDSTSNTDRKKSDGKRHRSKRDKDNTQSASTTQVTEGDSIQKDLPHVSSDGSPSKAQRMPPNPYLRKRATSQEDPLEIDFDSHCLEDKYLLITLETAEKACASKAAVTKEEESQQEPNPKKAKFKALDSLETRQNLERQTHESVTSYKQGHSKIPELPVVSLVSPDKISVPRNPYIKDVAKRFDSYCLDDEDLSQALDDCESFLAQSMSTQTSDSSMPSQRQTSEQLTPETQESLMSSTVPIVTPTKRLNQYRSASGQSRQPKFW